MSAPSRISKEQVYYRIRRMIDDWVATSLIGVVSVQSIINESVKHELAISITDYSYELQDNR